LRKFVDNLGPRHAETSLVFRLRLEDCVDRFDRLRLAVLSGPVGIGKTTLLARWHTIARHRGMIAGWLSLHRSGHDHRHFLADLANALEPAAPGFTERLRTMPALPNTGLGAGMGGALPALLDGLNRTDRPVVLFLDDYEAVSDPAIHRDLNLLLSTPPQHFTLAVASRVEPPFPLARLRACGGLLELQAPDLRFTLDEARYYLTRVQSLELTEEQVRDVTNKTEGRISGLQLAVLTRRLMAGERDALPEAHHRASRWLENLDARPCDGVLDGARSADQDMVLRDFAAVMVGYAAGAAGDLEQAMAQCRDAIEISGKVLETLQPESGKQQPHASDGLHHREIQILRLVSEGLRNREIGERLRISEDTVKWYLKRLFAKLYVTTRTSAVARGRELGLLP
jgi:ATP/maltotriose-dependent transcriptional regulator MalT